MSAPYQQQADPDLESPVLILALDGWIDAGFGAANAVATLLSSLDTYPVISFDADELLDHRARRPIMQLIDGVNTGLTWPAIELRAGTDLAGNDILLLVGAEPDHAWRAFSATVLDLCHHFGVRMIVGLGAYPAAVPHTRPTMLSCTANSAELAARWQFLRGSLEVPAGVHAAIERLAAETSMPAIGVWAQVPHYTAGMAYPAASLALIESASMVGDLSLPTGELARESREARERLDEIIAGNDDHARMVAALESEADSSAAPGPMPSGAELVAELEKFLREQGPESARSAACTVVTRNYLAFARLVGRSWTDHHPGSRFTIVVVDYDGMVPPTWVHRDIRIIGPAALGVSAAELEVLASIYGAAELACVLKPNAMRLLLEEVDAAIYIDGDVEVLDAMDDLEDLARARGVVLSPHNLHPLPDDGCLPDRFTMLKAGMFNGGLLAVGRGGIDFLDWWAAQLRRDGIHELAEGMHGDQRWLDFVPSYFDHHVLRDPTFNVAYWNLHERPTSWDGEALCLGDRRVRCFHYSGLLERTPWLLSQFMGDVPRRQLRDLPAVARQCRSYLDRLRTAGVETDLALGYRFANSADGTPVDWRARRLWRDQLLLAEADRTGTAARPPSPFAADGGAAWVDWLRTPADGDVVSRYLRKVWDESADLQRRHPDLGDPYQRAGYLAWVLARGTDEADIPTSLLPDHQDASMDDMPEVEGRPRRRGRRPDVRSQQPIDQLSTVRETLEGPIDNKGVPRSARIMLGRLLKGRDQRNEEVARALAEAVEELRARVAELGERVNRVNDELPDQAERLDQVADDAASLVKDHQELAERVDQLDVAIEAETDRLDGALEQDLITGSILADAEARLTAEVADLQLRLDKLADDAVLDDGVDDDDNSDGERKRKKNRAG